METSDAPNIVKRPRGRPPRMKPVQENPTMQPIQAAPQAEMPSIQQEIRGEVRPDMRGEVRQEVRDADPRAAAEARAKEILSHLGSLDEGIDEFHIPKHVIPDGWSYEWKTKSVFGAENPTYQVALARTGWKPVPRSRHPEMMPQNWPGEAIERKGQVLMERPQIITDMQSQTDKQRARDQVRVKEAQLSNAPQGHLPRAGDADGDGRTRPNIKKSYEPMPIPADR